MLSFLIALGFIVGIVAGCLGIYEFIRNRGGRGSVYVVVAIGLILPAVLFANFSSPSGAGNQGTNPGSTGGTQQGNSSTPIAPPTPTTNSFSPGTILCQFDATNGWKGWSGSTDWEVYNGELLSNGQTPSVVTIPTIVAPCQLSTSDYAVEARIRMNSGELIFGIEARGTTTANGLQNYSVYNETYGGNNIDIGGNFGSIVKTPWTPNTNWHTYRFELKGVNLALFIDGAQILQTTDYRYLTGWQTGLASAGTQLEVAYFKVIAL